MFLVLKDHVAIVYDEFERNATSHIVNHYWVVAVSRAALSEVVPFSCAHAGAVSAHDM